MTEQLEKTKQRAEELQRALQKHEVEIELLKKAVIGKNRELEEKNKEKNNLLAAKQDELLASQQAVAQL